MPSGCQGEPSQLLHKGLGFEPIYPTRCCVVLLVDGARAQREKLAPLRNLHLVINDEVTIAACNIS
eukprot:4706604-Amphidinium_carterae.1